MDVLMFPPYLKSSNELDRTQEKIAAREERFYNFVTDRPTSLALACETKIRESALAASKIKFFPQTGSWNTSAEFLLRFICEGSPSFEFMDELMAVMMRYSPAFVEQPHISFARLAGFMRQFLLLNKRWTESVMRNPIQCGAAQDRWLLQYKDNRSLEEHLDPWGVRSRADFVRRTSLNFGPWNSAYTTKSVFTEVGRDFLNECFFRSIWFPLGASQNGTPAQLKGQIAAYGRLEMSMRDYEQFRFDTEEHFSRRISGVAMSQGHLAAFDLGSVLIADLTSVESVLLYQSTRKFKLGPPAHPTEFSYYGGPSCGGTPDRSMGPETFNTYSFLIQQKLSVPLFVCLPPVAQRPKRYVAFAPGTASLWIMDDILSGSSVLIPATSLKKVMTKALVDAYKSYRVPPTKTCQDKELVLRRTDLTDEQKASCIDDLAKKKISCFMEWNSKDRGVSSAELPTYCSRKFFLLSTQPFYSVHPVHGTAQHFLRIYIKFLVSIEYGHYARSLGGPFISEISRRHSAETFETGCLELVFDTSHPGFSSPSVYGQAQVPFKESVFHAAFIRDDPEKTLQNNYLSAIRVWDALSDFSRMQLAQDIWFDTNKLSGDALLASPYLQRSHPALERLVFADEYKALRPAQVDKNADSSAKRPRFKYREGEHYEHVIRGLQKSVGGVTVVMDNNLSDLRMVYLLRFDREVCRERVRKNRKFPADDRVYDHVFPFDAPFVAGDLSLFKWWKSHN